MLKPYQVTPLKILFDVEHEYGTGRRNKKELIPTTPSAMQAHGIDEKVISYTRAIQNYTKAIPKLDLSKQLRPYQEEDVVFLSRRKSSACFNEQRTGKTPVALAWIQSKQLKKVLIVCPSSMVIPWAEQYNEWTGRNCIALYGTAKQREKKLSMWTDGLVIGYDCLKVCDHYAKDTGEYSHSTGDLAEVLKHKDIDGVIIDEVHRIRNHKTKTADAIFRLSKIENKLVLSGTPVLRSQEELYSTLHFLYPNLFTSYYRFLNYYFTMEQQTIYTASKKIQYNIPTTLKRPEELTEFLDIISTQRKRKEVMPWLPDKMIQTLYLDPTKEQLKYLTELRKYFEIEEEVVTQGILDRLIRERQICLTPALLGLRGASPKLEWIKNYISDYPEKSIIIFSKFTSWLKFLHDNIETETGLFTGEQTKVQRNKLKESFQAGKLKILLIQIDAGKEGLTLDTGEVIIFTDVFPPVGDIQQAEDRFVATTTDKADKEHSVYYLVMKETYEVEIQKGLEQSATEVDVINNYQKYLKGGD